MNIAQKVELDILNKRVVLAQERIADIKESCHHIITQTKHETAHCYDCQSHFGWWCPDSPDHVCHYFTENHDGERGVTLLNQAQEVHIFKDYNPEDVQYETDDFCLFCSQPDERK